MELQGYTCGHTQWISRARGEQSAAGDRSSESMSCLFLIIFQNRVPLCRLKQGSFELKILLLWPPV